MDILTKCIKPTEGKAN